MITIALFIIAGLLALSILGPLVVSLLYLLGVLTIFRRTR